MKCLCGLLMLGSLFITAPAYAQGIPVYDQTAFTQMVTQIQHQLQQLEQAVNQTNAMTGPRNMGSLHNSPLEAELRRYLPNSWEQTLDMMNAQGLGSLSGTRNIYASLTDTYKPISGADFLPSAPSSPIAQALDRRNSTTYASMAASEQAYNNISVRIETYESLLEELNNTEDLKASMDLQARIVAENGLILAELLRLQAIQMQQKAATDNEVLTTYRRAATSNRYDPAAASNAFRRIEE